MTTSKLKAWVEAMRLRTLPVSVAGVVTGCGIAVSLGSFKLAPALICLFFAIGAQVVSNFANEYYDWRNGLDRKGREGFRRGVTEGDITPGAMKRATYGLLAVVCLLGCSLIYWGGWWLMAVGAVIAVFALAYSAGPWPLSHHGWGDVAVVVFFGIVPVSFTAWLQTGGSQVWGWGITAGTGLGLMIANVLIVNNYRDMEDDQAVGKRTTVVIFGRKVMRVVYLVNGLVGAFLLAFAAPGMWRFYWYASAFYLIELVMNWTYLYIKKGPELNRVLASTAQSVLMAAVVYALCCVCCPVA